MAIFEGKLYDCSLRWVTNMLVLLLTYLIGWEHNR